MELSDSELKETKFEILEIKKDILKMIHLANSGHPGGSLSAVNLLYLLYDKIMKIDPENPEWQGRDMFILSKGHAAPALYAVLDRVGYIEREELFTLREFGSKLQGHPVKNSEMGIEVTTGSLGMGLSIGVGCALAAKLNKNYERNVYVLLGDGELNEGAVWEAAMAANHYKLDNLTAIIDRNGIQIDGATEEIMSLEPLADKWRAFGWNVTGIDGSHIQEIIDGFSKAQKVIKKPSMLISYLIKGEDISFMEHTKKYHGRPPDKQEYETAIREINEIQKSLREEKS
ncbi:MAG: transketolase [Promethearchaeia archaeon]